MRGETMSALDVLGEAVSGDASPVSPLRYTVRCAADQYTGVHHSTESRSGISKDVGSRPGSIWWTLSCIWDTAAKAVQFRTDLNVIIDPEEEDDPNEENADEGEENTDDPLRFADRPPRVPLDFLTIVDVSGVHELQVQWCGCPHALPPTEQLLNAGLFPSSQRVPRTCFTFRVLEDFLMDNLECKTITMSYFRKLRRLTNTAFPYKVPVCVYFASLNYSLTTGQDRYL